MDEVDMEVQDANLDAHMAYLTAGMVGKAEVGGDVGADKTEEVAVVNTEVLGEVE